MVDLSCSIAGIRLQNPFVLASGVRGNNAHLLIRAAKEGAGAVTSKSCSIKAREGHNNPTAIMHGDVMLNAIGLSNPGAEDEEKEIARAVKEAGVPIIASVYGGTSEDFAAAAKIIERAKPAMIELDISCPNVHREGQMFSSSCEGAEEVLKAVRAVVAKTMPLSVKLSPNVPNIGQIAKAAEGAGADCITAVNTMPAMWIDAHAKRAFLANSYGGLSGPALKPIALRCIREIRKNTPLPIIGGGGVTYGIDAAEMIMAGATAVSVGSAVCYRNNAFAEIKAELAKFMEEEKYHKLAEMKLIE